MLYCYSKKCITGIIVIIFFLLQTVNAAIPRHALKEIAVDSVKGKVLDNYGHPLENAEVSIKGTKTAVKTNNQGSFEIAATINKVLVFKHPGFTVYEMAIRNLNELTVRMQESYLKNPDSVKVLYSGLVPTDNVLGSISTIYTNQLTSTPSPTYAYALPGRLAGLLTHQYSGFRLSDGAAIISTNGGYTPQGGPDAGSFGKSIESTDNTEINLVLRGQSPITIVDGVQRSFYSLDPENIESVSVLKDGLSTILLGQRSSRGVILITTKKAQAGPPRISFTAQTGFQSPVKLPQPLQAYQYAYLYNEARQNEGKPVLYTPADVLAYQQGTDPYGHPNVNWFKTILKDNAPIRRYNLNIGGGSTFAKYNVSLGYLDQQGLFKTSNQNTYNTNDELQRYIISTDVEVTPSKNFSVDLKLIGRIQQGNQPGAQDLALFNQLYTTPNNAYPVFNLNGSPGASVLYPVNLYDKTINSGYIPTYSKDLVADLELNYKLTNWLPGLYTKIKGNFSVLNSNAANRSKSNQAYAFGVINGDTTYTPVGGSPRNQSNSFLLTSSAQYVYGQAVLGFDQQFGKHSINAMLFTDVRSVTINLDLPGKYTNNAVKAEYNYNNRYFAQAAVNYSGYDRFAPGHQHGLFYAGGLGWKISEEHFIKDNVSWINLLKLRATYAKTGNANVGYFTWRTSYTNDIVNGYYLGSNLFINSVYEGSLANVNATWEKGNKIDIGLDMSFLNNHLQATADYYNDRYYDLMQQRGKNTVLIGDTYSPENIGINRYTGAEFTVTYKNNFNNFNYFVTGNTSITKSKVVYMDEVIQPNKFNERTGKPVGAGFGYLADGFFQSQAEASSSPTISGYSPKAGDIRYKDIGGPNGKPDGVIDQFDQTLISSDKPVIFYGLTLGFSYKGFDMSVLLQGVQNSQIYLSNSPTEIFTGGVQAYSQELGRWTPETAATATYPRLTDATNINNEAISSFWMHADSYFRLKNVDIGYTLPYRWTSKFKVSSIRFFANGLNLFTQAQYERVDPEQSLSPANYPIQKVFNMGFNIKL